MTTAVQSQRKRKMNYRSRGKLLIHIILVIGSFVMIFPFVWMILTSFKSNGESLLIPPTLLPGSGSRKTIRRSPGRCLSVPCISIRLP